MKQVALDATGSRHASADVDPRFVGPGRRGRCPQRRSHENGISTLTQAV